MAINTACSSGDVDDEPDVCDEFGMAIVVCGVYGDNGIGTEVDEVFLWNTKARVDWFDNHRNISGDGDDIADYAISFWENFAD